MKKGKHAASSAAWNEARRLKELEDENRRLKHMVE